MYQNYDFVYGIPYTEEMEKILEARDSCYDELEEFGFEFMYDGAGREVTPGFLGITYWGGPGWEIPVDLIRSTEPTEEDKEKVQEMIDALPGDIKAVAPEPKLILVESDS